MERVLFLSTEPGCRSTISKNCKHHYFICKKVDTQQLKSWFDTPQWISLKWGWWGLQLVLHQEGQRAVAFPLPLSIHLTQKQAVMQKKVLILVNLPKYQTQALPRECLMAHFTSKNTFRMIWQGGCIKTRSLSRFWPFPPNWKYLKMSRFYYQIASQDHLHTSRPTE